MSTNGKGVFILAHIVDDFGNVRTVNSIRPAAYMARHYFYMGA